MPGVADPSSQFQQLRAKHYIDFYALVIYVRRPHLIGTQCSRRLFYQYDVDSPHFIAES